MKGRDADRGGARERASLHWFVPTVTRTTTAGAGPGSSRQPGAPSRAPRWALRGARALGSSTASPGTAARSWVRSGACVGLWHLCGCPVELRKHRSTLVSAGSQSARRAAGPSRGQAEHQLAMCEYTHESKREDMVQLGIQVPGDPCPSMGHGS